MQLEEPRWVELAAEGDKSAFTRLYETYFDEVFRFVAYRVNDLDEAEAISAQLFLKAWQNLPKFERRSSFRSWIFRMAHNVVIDHYRTRRMHTAIEDAPIMRDLQPSPETQLMAQEHIDLLQSILSQLSPVHQQVLVMRFINGMSPEEVAGVLQRSVGAVRVLQHRALKAAHKIVVAEGGML